MQEQVTFYKQVKLPQPGAQILLQASFNNAPDYQVLLNNNLEIVLFNEAASVFTTTAFGVELATNRKITDYTSPSFITEFEELCEKALKGQKISYEYFIRRDNEGAWYNFTLTPVYTKEKEVIGLSLVGSCIDDLKKQEKTINHQSKTLSFIAQLQSHQVRQPVSSILGLMSLIKEENYKPQKEYLLGLEEATKQLDSIIQLIVSKSRG